MRIGIWLGIVNQCCLRHAHPFGRWGSLRCGHGTHMNVSQLSRPFRRYRPLPLFRLKSVLQTKTWRNPALWINWKTSMVFVSGRVQLPVFQHPACLRTRFAFVIAQLSASVGGYRQSRWQLIHSYSVFHNPVAVSCSWIRENSVGSLTTYATAM